MTAVPDWFGGGGSTPWPRWVRPSLVAMVVAVFLLRTLGSLDVAVVGHLRAFMDLLVAQALGTGGIENPEILHTGMRLGGLRLYYLLHQPARLVPDPVVGLALLYGLLQLTGLAVLMVAARRRALREEVVWIAALIVAGTLGAKGVLLENSALMNALGTLGFGSVLVALASDGLGWWLLGGLCLAAGAQIHILGLAGLGAAFLAAALRPGSRRGLMVMLAATAAITLPGFIGLGPVEGHRAVLPPPGVVTHPFLELLDPAVLRVAPVPVAFLALVTLGTWAMLAAWLRHRPWVFLRAPEGPAPAAGALVLSWIGSVLVFGGGYLALSSGLARHHVSELLSAAEKLAVAMEAPVAVSAAIGLFLLWKRAPRRALRVLPPGSWRLLVAVALSLLCWNAARAVIRGPLRWRGTVNRQCSLGPVDETFPYLWINYVTLRALYRRTAAYRRVGFGRCAYPLDGIQTLDVLPNLMTLWHRPLVASERRRCGQVVMLPRTEEFEALRLPGNCTEDTWIAVQRCRVVPTSFGDGRPLGEIMLDLSEVGEAGTLLLTLADESRVLGEPPAVTTPGIALVATAAWPPALGDDAQHHWYVFSVEAPAERYGLVPLRLGQHPRPGTPEAVEVNWVRAPLGQQGAAELPLIGGREVLEACFVAGQ